MSKTGKNKCVHAGAGDKAHCNVSQMAQYDHADDLNPTGCPSHLLPVDQKKVPVANAVFKVRSCDVKVPFPLGHSATETEFNTGWLAAADFGTAGLPDTDDNPYGVADGVAFNNWGPMQQYVGNKNAFTGDHLTFAAGGTGTTQEQADKKYGSNKYQKYVDINKPY